MNKSDEWAIEVNELSYKYGDELVLDNVSFKVAPSALCAVVGPNGGGKSTLIKCITGLLSPTSGMAVVNCAHEHKQHSIGYVPQRHFVSDRFPVSVFEVVSSGRVLGRKKWFGLSRADKDFIFHTIQSVGLEDHAHSAVDELSGGQQQRVLIAKALAGEPEVLVLDEPTAGVDTASQQLFRETISHAIKDHQTTVLLVSHELSAVADLVDQMVVLKNQIIFEGEPGQLVDHGISLAIHDHDLPAWVQTLAGVPFSKDTK